MNDFDFENLQKKRLAGMAKYRRRGSKSKKCSLSTDHMTRRQWERRNGPVHTYDLNAPMTWDQFRSAPDNILTEYLTKLKEEFGVTLKDLAEMFGVSYSSVYRYLSGHETGISFPVGKRMTLQNRRKWLEFIGKAEDNGDSDEENASVEQPATGCGDTECQAEAEQDEPATRLSHFSLSFDGEIDPNMIANSILQIAGAGRHGRVEISCEILD